VSSDYQSGNGGSFTMSSDGAELQNVSVSTALACTPSFSGATADHVQFASIPVGSDGSFSSGQVTQTGTFDGQPATFTYTFSGDFHGTDSSGVSRAAGQLREDVTFSNGTSYSCTTNPQSWAATGP
jgi:hypothetical protein